MPPLETGYGWCFFPSQAVGQFVCTVCGAACEVSRDMDGPTRLVGRKRWRESTTYTTASSAPRPKNPGIGTPSNWSSGSRPAPAPVRPISPVVISTRFLPSTPRSSRDSSTFCSDSALTHAKQVSVAKRGGGLAIGPLVSARDAKADYGASLTAVRGAYPCRPQNAIAPPWRD